MIKIAFANNKGGVGKTTSAINLSGFLSRANFRVLVIDLDPSANLTIGFGFQKANMIGKLLMGEVGFNEAVMRYYENLDVLIASSELDFYMKEITRNKLRPFELLKFSLSGVVEDKYDFIIIDTQPNAKSTASLNALAYADYVIIPTEAEYFSVAGIAEMNTSIATVCSEMLNPNLKILGVLITFAERTRECIKNEQILRSLAGSMVFQTKIRKNTALAESASKGGPIADKNATGFWDYRDFTEELLNRIGVCVTHY